MLPLEGTPRTGPLGAGAARYQPLAIAETAVIAAIVATSVVAAAFSNLAPTASALGDLWWLALVGAAGPLAAVLAARWSIATLAATAALLSTGMVQLLAIAALAVAILSPMVERRAQLARVASAAVGVNALLRTEAPSGFELLALAAGTAVVAAVCWSAYRDAPESAQRVARIGGMGVAIVAGLLVAVGGLTILTVRADLESGIRHARVGLAQLNAADPDGAQASFERAERALAQGSRILSQGWLQPALGLPIIGPNLHATTELAQAGRQVATTAGQVAQVADPARLPLTANQFDIDALLAAHDSLESARDALQAALATADRVRSPWLVPPVASRLDGLERSLAEALPTTETLALIAEVAPPMLGAGGQRTYLVLVADPAESRASIGVVTSWALLSADRGHISLVETGEAAALGEAARDLTSSPDFPSIAQTMVELAPHVGLPPIDGVILMGPNALAAFGGVTGPTAVDGFAEPLAAEAIEHLLVHDRHQADPGALSSVITRAIFDRLDQLIVDPRLFGAALAPVSEAGGITMWSAHPDEANVLAQLEVDGRFPEIGAGTDLLSVRSENLNPSRIDVALDRTVSYVALVDPDGTIDARVTLALTNAAIDDPDLPDRAIGNALGLPRAWNRQRITIYTPHDLASLSVDDTAVDGEHRTELGVNAYSVLVDIPARSTVTIELDLSGTVAVADYHLVWSGQATVSPDQIDIDVRSVGEQLVRFVGTDVRPWRTGARSRTQQRDARPRERRPDPAARCA